MPMSLPSLPYTQHTAQFLSAVVRKLSPPFSMGMKNISSGILLPKRLLHSSVCAAIISSGERCVFSASAESSVLILFTAILRPFVLLFETFAQAISKQRTAAANTAVNSRKKADILFISVHRTCNRPSRPSLLSREYSGRALSSP